MHEPLPNKLYSLAEVEAYIKECDGFAHSGEIALYKQLLDTMRENERLRGALQYVANGEDTTVEKLTSDWEHYRNKHTFPFKDDSCKECGAVHNGSSEGLPCQYRSKTPEEE